MTNMTTKLTQPNALRLELIRANGFTDADILTHFQNGDLSPFQQVGNGEIDFSSLLEFANAQWEAFEQAVRVGYELSFLSINGIRNLIAARFGLQADQDYTSHEEYLAGLHLEPTQLEWLQAVLPKNWAIVAQGEAQAVGQQSYNIQLATVPLTHL